MNGFAAQGSITIDGIKKTTKSGFNKDGCLSLMNAKRNVIRGLANMLRTHLEGQEDWIEWRHLSHIERRNWLDRVAETLHWEVLNGGRITRLHSLSASEFGNTLIGGLA